MLLRTAPRWMVVFTLAATLASCTKLRQAEEPLPPPRTMPLAMEEKVDQDSAGAVVGGVEGGVPGGVAAGIRSGLDGEFNTEAYARIRELGFRNPQQDPLSTFSIDVDTASYANVRRFLGQGQLPPKDAVRIEEMVNYFRYGWAEPEGDAPFAVQTETTDCPWAPDHRLVGIGLRARSVDLRDVPARNLVFLLDVSGSMDDPRKLPLLKRAMALLADTLREQDRVSIVVYAGAAGLVLPPTPGNRQAEILAAIDRLQAGGSTAGGAGILLAYQVAQESFLEHGVNRVILATDGDFNVGTSSPGDLTRLVEEKRRAGVALTVLGFGMGNLKDATLEQLADSGDGNYAYVDTLQEARKVLVEEGGGTLLTLARDVKIQVELNPATVAAYRLVGYENRMLATEDFDDDAKDAGEMGAGHTVTALYEIVPAGAASPAAEAVSLKYQQRRTHGSGSGELMQVKVRYKEPKEEASRLLTYAVDGGVARASDDLRFASAVAELGLLLRASEHRGGSSFAHVIATAEASLGDDPGGYRREFVGLARAAARLAGSEAVSSNR